MKNLLKAHKLLKSILLIAMIMFIASQTSGQKTKPAESGYKNKIQ